MDRQEADPVQRGLCLLGAVLLLYLQPITIGAGLVALAVAVALNIFITRKEETA